MARILTRMQFMYVLARHGEENYVQMSSVTYMEPELRGVTRNQIYHQNIPDSPERRRICFVCSMS